MMSLFSVKRKQYIYFCLPISGILICAGFNIMNIVLIRTTFAD